MIRALVVLLQLGLLVFCLIECIRSDASAIRHLEKTWWLLLIVLIPIAGPIAWLVAGRPVATPRSTGRSGGGGGVGQGGRPPVKGPDDDPEFLAGLRAADAEHEQVLRRWEEDLRRREEEMRRDDPPESGGPGPDDDKRA